MKCHKFKASGELFVFLPFLVFLSLRRRRHRPPPMVLLCFVLDVDSFTADLFKAIKQVLHNRLLFTSDLDPRVLRCCHSLLFLFCSSWIHPFFFESNDTCNKICRTVYLSILTIFQINLLACFFLMDFPSEELLPTVSLSLPVVFFTLPAFRLSCLSSTLLDIIVHSCSTLKDIITSLLSLSVTVSGGIFLLKRLKL